MKRPPITGDGARSDDPELDELLQKTQTLQPSRTEQSLAPMREILEKLGNPHKDLPPLFHVAGTNGKGSVTAYLRAALESGGKQVHVYTSPHLVRFNERIRLGGRLIEDAPLKALLSEVLGVNNGQPLSFFEMTTAAALLAFSRQPADALVMEVGLGGRFDSTNVVDRPAVCGITQLGLDHQDWLGRTITDIAYQKAGIAKEGVPLVTARFPPKVTHAVGSAAAERGAPLIQRGSEWDATFLKGALHYRDRFGELELQAPRLGGRHQHDNAALAVAMLRHQDVVSLPDAVLRAAPRWAEWPARLQRLDSGALGSMLPEGSELYLDGGHNPAAARVIADFLKRRNREDKRPLYLILGMIEGKDTEGFLKPLAPFAEQLFALPVPDHKTQSPSELARISETHGVPSAAVGTLESALSAVTEKADTLAPPRVLICGSLYLAGAVLKANGTPPV